MTKKQLMEQMAKAANISKAEANKAINSLINGIEEAIKEENGRISLPGFGVFSKSYRNPRQGVNPITGEKITIDGRYVVKFKPGKTLKNIIL